MMVCTSEGCAEGWMRSYVISFTYYHYGYDFASHVGDKHHEKKERRKHSALGRY